MRFHFIASTGRTATTFLARVLDALDGVTACHEGYRSADKESAPLLPLINLENRRAFDSPDAAREIVAEKRSIEILDGAAASCGTELLIDVAYYNCPIATALLEHHPEAHMVGIIRALEPFVRSATAVSGEDPLPVGWATPEKPLTAREKFIAMGRIRPKKGSEEAQLWPEWSAIMRNIWLWRETNQLLAHAKSLYPDRVLLLGFEELERDSDAFVSRIAEHFQCPGEQLRNAAPAALTHRNRKPAGYEVGPIVEWTEQERLFAQAAQSKVGGSRWRA